MGLAVLVGACGMFGEEERLEGERIRIRADADAGQVATVAAAPLPQPERLSNWTQVNSAPTHYGGHIAGSPALERAWTADAGSAGERITGAPIVVGGRVYVLDGAAQLSSFDASSGARAWRVNLAPAGERGTQGFGGGLATIDGSVIYATTGFGEVLALDAASGDVVWRQRFGAPFRAAPAAANGIVVAVNRNNEAFGLDARTGQPVWRLQGTTAGAGLLGGASPAIAADLAVVPFASGELVGAVRQSGQRVWSAVLSGGGRGLARAPVADATGDPVIVGPLVVAANRSGRLAAMDARSGQRIWTRSIGSAGPIWAAGETLFVMGEDARLRRLSARTGQTVWEAELPAYRDPEDREGVIAYSGPVLVGGRVLVTDSAGRLLVFDAESGDLLANAGIGQGSTVGPVVAEGMIYVLDQGGRLHAFR